MKLWMKAAMAVATVGLLAGCSKSGGAVETINIKIDATAYSPKEITVSKGKTYQLVVDNKDVQLHDFSIDKIPANIAHGHAQEHSHDMGGKDPELHVAADTGKTETLTFTPTEKGTYEFYCTVPGHKEIGMVGKLIVK